MDQKLVWFRAKNATSVVKVVTEHLTELAFKGSPVNDDVRKYALSLQDRLNTMFPDCLPLPTASRP